MGGELEKPLPKSGGTAVAERRGKGGSLDVNAGIIRVHQSEGEVHFHDDPAKLKVAVPVPDFIQAYLHYIQSPQDDLIIPDWGRMTAAILTYSEEVQGTIIDSHLDVRVEKIDTGPVTVTDSGRGTLVFREGKATVSVDAALFAQRFDDVIHGKAVTATFIDTVEQTRAVVTLNTAGPGTMALAIKVQKIRATGALAMLNDFVEGR